MSFAICVNLDQSKTLSSGNGLTNYREKCIFKQPWIAVHWQKVAFYNLVIYDTKQNITNYGCVKTIEMLDCKVFKHIYRGGQYTYQCFPRFLLTLYLICQFWVLPIPQQIKILREKYGKWTQLSD